jgi:hypothetical protein
MDWDDDDWEISDEEFAAAKAEALERFGVMPLSLQRILDMGGRFGRPARQSARDDCCCYPDVPCSASPDGDVKGVSGSPAE